MTACLIRFSRARFVALVALFVALCPADRIRAGVTTSGVVTPIPPANGGTATTQLIVGAGTDDSSNNIWGWVSVNNGTLLQYGSLIVGDNEGFFGEVNVFGKFCAGCQHQLNSLRTREAAEQSHRSRSATKAPDT